MSVLANYEEEKTGGYNYMMQLSNQFSVGRKGPDNSGWMFTDIQRV